MSASERAAVRERARELKVADNGEAACCAAIAAMIPADRALAERLHAMITESHLPLAPRTWYGMPAYARNGKVVCFFQSAGKFKTRYCTLGFSEHARLDDGPMWPTAFALQTLGDREAAQILTLIQRAVASA